MYKIKYCSEALKIRLRSNVLSFYILVGDRSTETYIDVGQLSYKLKSVGGWVQRYEYIIKVFYYFCITASYNATKK